jgi:hypothetical protein
VPFSFVSFFWASKRKGPVAFRSDNEKQAERIGYGNSYGLSKR